MIRLLWTASAEIRYFLRRYILSWTSRSDFG